MLNCQTHRLRAIEPGDVEQLLDWENDASTWWIGASLSPYSKAVMVKYAEGDHDIYRDKQLRFMLDACDEKGLWYTVGAVDLYDYDPRNHRAGVGIVVDLNERRKGHALVGLYLLSRYAFEHLGAHQLYAEVPGGHDPSINLFKKAGYGGSEVRRDWVRKGTHWKDVILLQKFAEN
jgi:diamine N-acetyltransferase